MTDTDTDWRTRLNLPAYQLREAARIAQVSPQTISGWFYGYPQSAGERSHPVFPEQKNRREPLSFLQLIEVAFVATCRRAGMRLTQIRRARAYLAETFVVDHPFADLRLIGGAHILADLGASELVAADLAGQVAWKDLMIERFREIDYDNDLGLAFRWFPRGRAVPVVIDPRRNFGKPVLIRSGVATWAVANALVAGESEEDVMLDYGVDAEELSTAWAFEVPKAA